MSQLNDKIALVVGTSRGLGRTIALYFADAGADVAVASRSPEVLGILTVAAPGTHWAARLA